MKAFQSFLSLLCMIHLSLLFSGCETTLETLALIGEVATAFAPAQVEETPPEPLIILRPSAQSSSSGWTHEPWSYQKPSPVPKQPAPVTPYRTFGNTRSGGSNEGVTVRRGAESNGTSASTPTTGSSRRSGVTRGG